MPTTILLADDHPLFRKGLRLLLDAEQDFKVVGEADDGQEAIDRVQDLLPDVVVMDINMPNFNGIDATRHIVSDFPGTKIVALSIHSGKRYIEGMLRAGAAGYILKECAPEELVRGVRAVMCGETFLSPSVQGIVISEFVRSQPDLKTTETIPIIRTKLYRPPLPKEHVHRLRLLEELEKGRRKQLTLVSAPAGYGKSVLVSCWLENCACPNAWFSVDESDNNLRQFLTYFLTAIRILFPDAMEDTLTLANTANLPSLKVLAGSLVNEMNLIEQDYILVLDDIHLIQEKQVFDLLTELLRYPPQRMHLVLIGRRDPFLPISSFRAHGRMTEIRLQDLCFMPSETKAYLEQMLGEQIEDAVAAKWTEKTEGWIVGLHLAALSMRERDDAADMLTDIPGGLQYVTEYLFNEVFESQPPEIRQYLLITAILDRFCAPFCDALCAADEMLGKGEIDGQEFVNWLQKDNLFVIPLDTESRWFRYHHLFQQLLQDQLKIYYCPEDIAELHSRASEWLEGKGLIEKALHHALAAGEIERVAQIIKRHRQNVVNADQWYLLDKWLSLIPETFMQQQAELLMARAWVLLHHFRFETVLRLVDHVEALIADDPAQALLRGEVELCRGYSLFFMGEGADSLKHIVEALERIPFSHYEARAQAEVIFALSSQMVGQKEHAIRGLDDLLANYDSPDDLRKTRLLITYVFIHFIAGDLVEAELLNRRLWQVAERGGYAYARAWTAHMKGLIHLHRCDWEAAVEHLERSVAQRFIHFKRAAADSITGLALAYQALGREDDAQTTMQVFRDYAASLDDPALWGLVGSAEARLAIMQGRPEHARHWLEASTLRPEGAMLWWLDVPSVTRCRALIAEGSPARLDEAEKQLRKCAEMNEAHHNTWQLIVVRALQAIACQKHGKAEEALEFLERAVTLARPGGIFFTFLEIGPPMKDLLLQLQEQNISSDFIEKLLAAFGDDEPEAVPDDVAEPQPAPEPSARPQPLVEPLTNRELDILDLLAQRLQNKEIADKLFISTETVKTHLNNIYQKLAVSNRRQAVEKAKKLGIL